MKVFWEYTLCVMWRLSVRGDDHCLCMHFSDLWQGFGTARELLYLKALESGLMHGNFRVATESWERILVDHPRDLLAVRACHDAYIILGDPQAMRDSIA
jgi:hypothetical protein